MVTRPVTKGVTKGSNQGVTMHGFQAEKARKSTKSPICMTRARPRICMNFQTVFAGCQLFTRSTFCAWFAVRFLAVQRTEILLLHACCSKNLVCTCISVPFQRNFSQLVTRFFSTCTAANFIQLYGYWLGYCASNHSGNQVLVYPPPSRNDSDVR